ncbi:hypothetical protein MTP99_013107 [Tenebrio molitor]|nr:hypothetical protein MTP99_013107 [Tenebrio molitor]
MDSHPVWTLPRVLKSFRKFSDLPSRFCGFTEIKICTVGLKDPVLCDADARIMLLEESQHILVIEPPLLPARPEAPVQATHPTSVDPIEEEVEPKSKRPTSAITPEDLTVESGPRQPLRAPGEWHQTGVMMAQQKIEFSPGDVCRLCDEVTVLRHEVQTLQKERQESYERLAIADARIVILEEGQRVTGISPPDSPVPGPSAEPFISEN